MSKVSKTILCIEDDRQTAELIAEELLDRGFDIELAHDGREGLEAIFDLAPDLVLCDISLPHISGFDLLERVVKRTPRFTHMPFIFLTALADRESELRGRQLGADDYVAKPIDFDLLVAIINVRLSRTSSHWEHFDSIALNDREIETLTWAARGKTSAEIGQIINLAKRTVDFHIDNARVKLGVATRIQAVIKATNYRLIEP